MADQENLNKDQLIYPPPQYSDDKPPLSSETYPGKPFPVTQQPPVIAPGGGPAPPPPKDYLVHSILVILCCFWPIGAIALYKVIEARRLYNERQYAAAESAAKEAGQFSKIGCIVGCLLQGLTWCIILVTWAIIGITFGILAAVGVFNNATSSTK